MNVRYIFTYILIALFFLISSTHCGIHKESIIDENGPITIIGAWKATMLDGEPFPGTLMYFFRSSKEYTLNSGPCIEKGVYTINSEKTEFTTLPNNISQSCQNPVGRLSIYTIELAQKTMIMHYPGSPDSPGPVIDFDKHSTI